MSSTFLEHLTMSHCPASKPRQAGFGAMAAVFVLVILATLAAAVARLGWTQQTSFSQDLLSAKANQAARAGLEWGMYQALKGTWTSCSAASQTLDLRSEMDMWVTVTCDHDSFNESETSGGAAVPVKVYTVTAVACNGTASCPDNTAAVTTYYVERKQQAILSDD
jgi:MSHA biogenesis protein MshP